MQMFIRSQGLYAALFKRAFEESSGCTWVFMGMDQRSFAIAPVFNR